MSTVAIDQPIFPPGTIVSLYAPTDVDLVRRRSLNPRHASKVAAISAGVSAVAAAGGTGVVASNNAITWTAKTAGSAGNGITVTLRKGGASEVLSVNVNGNDILVLLATNGGGAITSTAAQVKTAIAADAEANALVAVSNTGASNATGVVAAEAVTLAGGVASTATDQAVVDSKGTLPITAAAGSYVAAGQVGSEWRYLSVDVD